MSKKRKARQKSASQKSAGQQSAGQQSAGQQSAGQRSASQQSAGQQSAGQQSAGQRSASQQSAGQQSAGQRSASQQSASQQSAGQQSAGQQSASQQSASQQRPQKRRWRPTRRGFLIGAGATGAALALGVYIGLPYQRQYMASAIEEGTLEGFGGLPSDPNMWLEVLDDSRIRLYVTKVEMGQGVHTSIGQLAVEELGIAWDDLDVKQASTATGIDDSFGTGGSTSVPSAYLPIRQAAATLRHLLFAEAASVLNVATDALVIDGRGIAVANDRAQRVDFFELTANRGTWEVPEEPVPLKAENDFTVIGQPIPRKDIPAKVTGEAVYGYDTRLPDMLYGVAAKPPTIEGKMKIAWPMTARDMPGVETVVVDHDNAFVGVAARSRAEARAALDSMRIEWDEGKLWQQAQIDRMIEPKGSGGVVIQNDGNAVRELDRHTTLAAEYRSPFAVQTPLEPQSALADVQEARVRIWVSTQSADRTKGQIAEAIGVDPAIIDVIPTYLGGGFGRKLDTQVAIEAAKLSQAASAPVHVGWDRAEALRHGYFRPPTHSKLSGALDENGRIVAMEHRQGSGDVAFGFLPKFLEYVIGSDFGSWRGSYLHYDVPNRKVEAWSKKLPVWTGWWRGLGLLANTFAIESFMDDLAHAAGANPLQFRLDHMPDSEWGRRMGLVLEAAAEKANWGGTLPTGHAQGIACSSDVDTMVAQVAEVSVDEETGHIRVHQVTCAMDCGLTVNPDGAQAQIQGSIMWGTGSALIEQMYVKDGRIDLSNFDTYPLLSMDLAPHVETVLLEAGDGKPRGVGEPPMGPVAAAIGNGFTQLTGKRLYDLPMTPERVLAALT